VHAVITKKLESFFQFSKTLYIVYYDVMTTKRLVYRRTKDQLADMFTKGEVNDVAFRNFPQDLCHPPFENKL